jgi:osmotically inducible lipoprotein OsmB
MKTWITVLIVALLGSSLVGCANMSRRDQRTVAGAAIGGVAGHVLTGGSAVGTVGGAVGGAVIGNQWR